MLIKSFAKINLALKVNKKLKNGFHDIQSFYCLIDLHDEIKIQKNKRFTDTIKFEGKFKEDIKKQKNSIFDTLKILRSKKLIKNYYSIKIKKKIPVFAGLGGGTSNAFYLAKYLTKSNLNKNLINKLEEKIGSDFRLFFHNQGFLQSLRKTFKLKKANLYFILIFPKIKCSTKKIYSNIKKYSPKLRVSNKLIKNKKKFINLLKSYDNDLQLIVEKKYPLIKKILSDLEQIKGCYFSRMTGSGSTCYGVFNSEISAKVALNKIKKKYPKFWLTFAKTI